MEILLSPRSPGLRTSLQSLEQLHEKEIDLSKTIYLSTLITYNTKCKAMCKYPKKIQGLVIYLKNHRIVEIGNGCKNI